MKQKTKMKRKTKRNIIVYVSACILFLVLVAGFYVYGEGAEKQVAQTREEADTKAKAEAEQRLPKVKVVEVLPIPLTDYLVLPGTVRPYEEIDLAAKSAGTVKWVGPKEGDQIQKGEKLLKLDMELAATRVTEARARYKQAKKDYDRMKKLSEEGIVSRGQFDTAKTALDTSKAALDAVEVSLNDGSLTSPISGILDRLNVDQGEYINPGQTVMKIVNINTIKVELPVPEKDILYFNKGQHVEIEMENTKGEKRNFSGVIDFVSMTAENTTRTYVVKVVVNNSEQILRPGMIVRAHLVRRDIEEAIAVPFFTIIDREDGKAVFVVEDGVARVRPIEYGIFQRGIVEIRSGLAIGEQLVIVGQRNLVDGEHVEVTDNMTLLAKQWIDSGEDLSELSIETLQ
jgi:membrane fusion protein (multidrug efflux system)